MAFSLIQELGGIQYYIVTLILFITLELLCKALGTPGVILNYLREIIIIKQKVYLFKKGIVIKKW